MSEPTAQEIAVLVAQLVADRLCEPIRLLDTQSVAGMLAVSDDWVRAHAAELGAIRVGDGPNGALRFDARRVRAALERRRIDRPDQARLREARQRRRSLRVVPAVVPADVKDW